MNFQLTWQKMPVYITTMHSHLLLLKVCKRNFQLNGNFLFPYLGTILHPHLRLCRRNYRQNTKNRKLEIALNFKLSALDCCQIDLVLKWCVDSEYRTCMLCNIVKLLNSLCKKRINVSLQPISIVKKPEWFEGFIEPYTNKYL